MNGMKSIRLWGVEDKGASLVHYFQSPEEKESIVIRLLCEMWKVTEWQIGIGSHGYGVLKEGEPFLHYDGNEGNLFLSKMSLEN